MLYIPIYNTASHDTIDCLLFIESSSDIHTHVEVIVISAVLTHT